MNVEELISRINTLQTALKSTDPKEVTSAIGVVTRLIQTETRCFEPFFIKVLPVLLHLVDHKYKNVAEESEECVLLFLKTMNPFATNMILEYIFGCINDFSWKKKLSGLKFISTLANSHCDQIAHALPSIVPVVKKCCWDTKSQVAKAASECLMNACVVVKNPDIKCIIADLVAANSNPSKNEFALDRLMGTTFVSQVERSMLSIIVPILERGLKGRCEETKRKCCVVVSNMCKLVNDAKDVEPFQNTLFPLVQKVSIDSNTPEIREIASDAFEILKNAIEKI